MLVPEKRVEESGEAISEELIIEIFLEVKTNMNIQTESTLGTKLDK